MMPVYIAQYLCFQSLERTDTQENNKSLQMSKYSAKAIETKDWAKKMKYFLIIILLFINENKRYRAKLRLSKLRPSRKYLQQKNRICRHGP